MTGLAERLQAKIVSYGESVRGQWRRGIGRSWENHTILMEKTTGLFSIRCPTSGSGIEKGWEMLKLGSSYFVTSPFTVENLLILSWIQSPPSS